MEGGEKKLKRERRGKERGKKEMDTNGGLSIDDTILLGSGH